MKITFVLPPPTMSISGGYKMVYEYSNRLLGRNHGVTIIYDSNYGKNQKGLPLGLAYFLRIIITKIAPTWFRLNKGVKQIAVKEITNNTVPKSDVIIATAAETAIAVNKLNEEKGKKYYFIQDYENWNLTDEEVCLTYGFEMKKIVISKWLKQIVDLSSMEPSVYIPNGIDFHVFGIDIPSSERNPRSIAMLYHHDERKGVKYGLEVINGLKIMYTDLEVRLFGTPKRPKDLPHWIEYTNNANHKQLRMIYNKTAVFLSASIEEGFGLTGAESMACGCALVSTAYKGVFEYAENGMNALISPVMNVEYMVNNIIKLFANNELRISIANQGARDIKKLSLENSIVAFEQTLKEF